MFATFPAEFAAQITVLPLSPDVRVFGFMLAAALMSAVIFGLAPAIQATRADVMIAARGEFTSDIRPVRLRNTLVVVQVTACVLLLICAGVLLRGANAMKQFDIGFRTRNVLALTIAESLRSRTIEQLFSEPEIQSIAAVGSIPLNGLLPSISISARAVSRGTQAWYNHVSPEYFELLDIPILSGRNFTATDANSAASVVVISEAMARQLFPDRDAVGEELQIHNNAQVHWGEGLPRPGTVQVVGIARDIVSCCIALYGRDPALIYFPATVRTAKTSLLMRTRGNVEMTRQKLNKKLATWTDGGMEGAHTLDQFYAGGIYPFRAASWISFCLGTLALLLTLSGIYSVLSYLIAQRTKEIGIRVALGAPPSAVVRLVLKHSVRLAAIGIGLGTALSLAASRILASRVIFINTFDAASYGAGIFLVLAATLAAAYFPTRRAAAIDPMTTLRCD